MAVFNVLNSVSDYFEAGPEKLAEFNAEEFCSNILKSSKICIFALEENCASQQAILTLRLSGVTKFSRAIYDKNCDEELQDCPTDSEDNGLSCQIVDFSKFPKTHANFPNKLLHFSGRKAFPLIFIKGDCIGGNDELRDLLTKDLLQEYYKEHDYDLVVIGGGSGGLAASKRAAIKGKKVAVLDFVKPTPIGTTWGLGGTCVNVGCIPKKLMHQAAILGKSLEDAKKFGWQVADGAKNDWKTMVTNIKNHILSLNYGAKVELRQKSCTYINGYGSFVDSHTVKAIQKDGKEVILTSDRFLIATGLRPKYLDISGAKEYCITSDDLFTLKYPPGKTLLVGASYVSLECGGFLKGVGFDVTVMVRSILLRGFDQDMAERIGKHMEDHEIKLIRQAIPTKIEKIEEGTPGLYCVTYTQTTPEGEEEYCADFNTIVLAIGREAVTDDLNLDGVNDLRVIGIHYLGPNAGEVTQGFGLALKLKAKMSDLTSLVGIHPTTAE
uniref:thioredoxin-disulfide reductase (NADPH) n=1 Tax=Romanomermis culicivorax TaxID=13658 RepID=A0A915K3F6_ROMCU